MERSASEGDFDERENRIRADQDAAECVERERDDLDPLVVDVILEHDLKAELQVIEQGRDQQDHQEDVGAGVEPRAEAGERNAGQLDRGDHEPDAQRNERHFSGIGLRSITSVTWPSICPLLLSMKTTRLLSLNLGADMAVSQTCPSWVSPSPIKQNTFESLF